MASSDSEITFLKNNLSNFERRGVVTKVPFDPFFEAELGVVR
jgi:hypothetical protein